MKTTELKSPPALQRNSNAAPFFQPEESREVFFGSKQSHEPFFKAASPDGNNPKPSTIQAKLSIGAPDDAYEQEADAMADTVVQKLASSDDGASVRRRCAECAKGDAEEGITPKLQKKSIFESNEEPANGQIQRKCQTCATETIQPLRIQRMGEEEEPALQAKGDVPGLQASPDLESRLNTTKGSGSPLPDDTRTSMESSFGADFSNVRVHTNNNAAQMNRELGAQAFTHGSDIYFNSGKYDTGSSDGQHLLAHELTHTVQQGGSLQTRRINPRIQREASMLFDPEQTQTDAGTTVPSGVHLGTHRRGRAYMLDWDSRDRSFSPEAAPGTGRDSTMRQIFEAHRQQQLETIFGTGTTLAQVQDQIRAAQAQGNTAEVSRLQSQLFRANQYAVVATLNVEDSSRYARTDTSTYCNIYSYDMVSALGGYLPRVWWTSRALRRIQGGATVISREEYNAMSSRERRRSNVIAPVYGRTVHELNANALTSWMETWGTSFGWQQAADAEAAQEAANSGHIVIILAANRRARRSGHVNVVLAESPEQQLEANRDDAGVVQAPLQSQAGSTNFKYRPGRTAWWRDSNHERGGFWIFSGTPRSPIATPEELGTPAATPAPTPAPTTSVTEPTVQPKFADRQSTTRHEQEISAPPQISAKEAGQGDSASMRATIFPTETPLAHRPAVQPPNNIQLRRGRRPTNEELNRQAAEQVRDQMNRGGLTVAFYVSQRSGVSGIGEFKRQANRFAADHNAIAITSGGNLRAGQAMEITQDIPSLLLSLTETSQDILNQHPDLSDVLIGRTIDIQNLAIFTHGLRHGLQAGPRARWIGAEADITPRRARDNWIELGEWVANLAPFLTPSPQISMYSCSVSGDRSPTELPFAEALRRALQQELRDLYGPGETVEPEIWGHTTAAHTTANPFLAQFSGDQAGDRSYLMIDYFERFLNIARTRSGFIGPLSERQDREIRNYAQREFNRALIVRGSERPNYAETFIREIPNMGMENAWTYLTTTGNPDFSYMHLSASGNADLLRGLEFFRRRLETRLTNTVRRINRVLR